MLGAEDHELTLTFCCANWQVQPAHGHRPTPHCSCGWEGEEHSSKLEAHREGAAHLTGEPYNRYTHWARDNARASARLEGREIPAGYSRSEQMQQLVDKLRQLRHRKGSP